VTAPTTAKSFLSTSLSKEKAMKKLTVYLAFYKDKKIEVYADTSYEAQKKAAEVFKAKKSYEVTVVLAEKNGETITHNGSEF
jgi:hypothetical protein